MEEMPEELWAYVLDEIIYEAQLPKYANVEKSMIDNYKSKQERMLSEVQRKRKNAAIENLETIKTNHINQIEERKRTLERDKRLNELYPKNLRDDTKSATHERKEQKKKQIEQYEMLQEQ